MLIYSCDKYKQDTTPPVITLVGTATVNVVLQTTYIDQGATATDDVDGDLTSSIVVNNPVNTSIKGIYTVTYTVYDHSWNKATATETVNVLNSTRELGW